MCGIVAYVGHQQAHSIIIKGLKRLEYRGYDSAGIALVKWRSLLSIRRKERYPNLRNHSKENLFKALLVWATPGGLRMVNQMIEMLTPIIHPMKQLAIIHNGIIENYSSIKQELINKGHTFLSDTDTEVLIHFIEDIKDNNDCSLEEAVRLALTKVVGAYAIVIMSKEDPTVLIAARKGSPLVIGVGKE